MKRDLYEKIVSYVVENQNKFYRLAYSYVRDREDALDAVQSAVCKALENYGGIRNEGAINTWFYRILVNESLALLGAHPERDRGGFGDKSQHCEGETLSGIKAAQGEYAGGGRMRTLKDAKERYDRTEIPQELSGRVLQEVGRAGRRRRKLLFFRRARMTAASAAAAALVFATALNTSTTFAETMGNLPVIGAVARVLTFRSYDEASEDWNISVEIPSVEMISEDFGGLEQSVNEEILSLCEEYVQGAKMRAEEYRQAFLETGGTQEEWEAHDIRIRVWYEVKSQTDEYLSLAIMGTENWNSANNQTRYYNFDLKTGKLVSLEDLLGAGYRETADRQIRSQMEERKAQGAVYFDEFEGVGENTEFYLNEAGNPVIVFETYEIAPGSEGRQEFEIAME